MYMAGGELAATVNISACLLTPVHSQVTYHLKLFAAGGERTPRRPLGAGAGAARGRRCRSRRGAGFGSPRRGQVEEETEEEPDGDAREEVRGAEARRQPRLLALRQGSSWRGSGLRNRWSGWGPFGRSVPFSGWGFAAGFAAAEEPWCRSCRRFRRGGRRRKDGYESLCACVDRQG